MRSSRENQPFSHRTTSKSQCDERLLERKRGELYIFIVKSINIYLFISFEQIHFDLFQYLIYIKIKIAFWETIERIDVRFLIETKSLMVVLFRFIYYNLITHVHTYNIHISSITYTHIFHKSLQKRIFKLNYHNISCFYSIFLFVFSFSFVFSLHCFVFWLICAKKNYS